jgi:hypothetical protein
MKQLNPTMEIPGDDTDKQLLNHVFQAIKSIKYGYVQITIQNGQVVQIDKTEKMRLNGQILKIRGGDSC